MRTQLLVLAVLSSLAAAGSAHAATFTVNTTTDSGPGASNPCTLNAPGCSLRDAVIAANAAPGSTINVPAGNYRLTVAGQNEDAAATGDLDLNQPMTIVGAGAAVTAIDGNNIDRVFEIRSAVAAGTVTLSNLTVTGGNGGGVYGGGINANGTGSIAIVNSAVTGNTDPGGFGGGIMDDQGSGTALTVANSTFSSNGGDTTTGGGLWTSAQTDIVNSTFSGNTSDTGGGGGIHLEGAPTSITNSTVASNTAPDGNAGGIYAFNATVNVKNSIVAANTGGNCDSGALPASQGHNIDDGSSCGFTQPGDRQNTNPQLGPLQDNGGPTPTRALPKGSPAVDAGDNAACPAADQRGLARPFDGDDDGIATCDIGAFELRGPPPTATTGLASGVTSASASVSGLVNPNGFVATYHFEYGPTPAYGSATPPAGAGAGAADLPVTAGLSSLMPDTVYHYRLVASGAGGTVTGADATFTTATAPSQGLGPPVMGVTANVEPVKGVVYVALPAVQSPARNSPGSVAARIKGFGPLVKLTGAAQIPIGSLLDTKQGTVRLFTAKNHAGATQNGDFSKGDFIVQQSKHNPLSTAAMTGGNLKVCSKLPPGGSAKTVVAARRRSRSLFSNVHGRFRTRGRNSAATVRGTAYLVKDTCSGTLTSVRRGVVSVRDFTLRKTVKVKARHRYFARAPKRRH